MKQFQYVHIVGDASSVGYGAFTTHGHGELPSPMVVSSDSMEINRMQDNQLPSILRKTTNARLAVDTPIDNLHASQLAGTCILFHAAQTPC